MPRPTGPRSPSRLLAAIAGPAALLAGCSTLGTGSAEPLTSGLSTVVATARATASATPTVIPTPTAIPATTSTPAARPTARAGSGLPALDRLAGLRSNKVAWRGAGTLRVVPGAGKAPGKGRIHRVRVEVEAGLNVEASAFADYVLATLNDRRSWTENGRRRFARTDGAADIRVVLASPQTSAELCRPLRTFGKLSCRRGNAAVLTMYRWTKAIPAYSRDRDGYRRYLVNHEVGHVLGHGHEYCPGRGRMAPVMMQQTKGLNGCRPNSWPHP